MTLKSLARPFAGPLGFIVRLDGRKAEDLIFSALFTLGLFWETSSPFWKRDFVLIAHEKNGRRTSAGERARGDEEHLKREQAVNRVLGVRAGSSPRLLV
jgi:hypothetical protein